MEDRCSSLEIKSSKHRRHRRVSKASVEEFCLNLVADFGPPLIDSSALV